MSCQRRFSESFSSRRATNIQINSPSTVKHRDSIGIYLLLARVGTIYYFLHFIVVMPVVGFLEKTDPIPMSISEPVLSGGAEPSVARKANDKI